MKDRWFSEAEIVTLIQQKADAIRKANTYRGKVNQMAEQSAIWIEDLKKKLAELPGTYFE